MKSNDEMLASLKVISKNTTEVQRHTNEGDIEQALRRQS